MSTTRTPKKTFMGISTRARVRPNVTRHSEESKVENQKGCTTQESERRDVVVWNRDRFLGGPGHQFAYCGHSRKSNKILIVLILLARLTITSSLDPSVRCFGRPLGGGGFCFHPRTCQSRGVRSHPGFPRCPRTEALGGSSSLEGDRSSRVVHPGRYAPRRSVTERQACP